MRHPLLLRFVSVALEMVALDTFRIPWRIWMGNGKRPDRLEGSELDVKGEPIDCQGIINERVKRKTAIAVAFESRDRRLCRAHALRNFLLGEAGFASRPAQLARHSAQPGTPQ